MHRLAVGPGDLVTSDKGTNKLSVKIYSAKLEAEKAARDYPYVVPSIAHVGTFAEHKGHVRKAGADFGWDWGPALGPHGIFGSIYLLADGSKAQQQQGGSTGAPSSSASYMQYAHLRQRFAGETIHLTAHAVVARPAGARAGAGPVEGSLRFAIPELDIDESRPFKGDAQTCRAATSGPAGGVECDVMIKVGEIERCDVCL